MNFICFGSSSKGNSYLLEADGELLLIDAGLSCKRIVDGMAAAGYDPSALHNILITHNHADHIAALPQLVKRLPQLQIFANGLTIDACCRQLDMESGCFCEFENGNRFDLGGFAVETFKTSHDAADSVGYFVSTATTAYFHATDLGITSETIGRYFQRAEVATLESNHDLEMLYASGRERKLIDRIRGANGHLSNAQAAEFVRTYAPSAPRLRKLRLAHLSPDCNVLRLARESMESALAEIGRADVEVEVLS